MHILLADDHDLVRETLRFYLEKPGNDVTVTEAATFPGALDLAESNDDLDIIILDMRMPGMDGLRGLKTMREKYPNLPVVILSGFLGRKEISEALALGAAGVIPKTLHASALFSAIQLIMAGETYIPAMIFSDEESAGGTEGKQSFSKDNPLTLLTRRESEVLDLLAYGHPNKYIADKLGLKEVTIKLHLRGIFRKLDVSNRTQAVRKAMELGWDM